MYIPSHFDVPDTEALHGFIRRHPLGTLVIHAGEGLVADHVPLSLRTDLPPNGKLLGHVARANPLWKTVATPMDCLVVFHGVQHYISPNGYASKAQTGKVVPTWNYEVVHVNGTIRSIDDRDWLGRFLEELTREHEATETEPWRLADAPDDYIDRMLQAVVGIEVDIARLLGKAKLSQNQPTANRRSLVDALRSRGDPFSDAMADAIEGRAR